MEPTSLSLSLSISPLHPKLCFFGNKRVIMGYTKSNKSYFSTSVPLPCSISFSQVISRKPGVGELMSSPIQDSGLPPIMAAIISDPMIEVPAQVSTTQKRTSLEKGQRYSLWLPLGGTVSHHTHCLSLLSEALGPPRAASRPLLMATTAAIILHAPCIDPSSLTMMPTATQLEGGNVLYVPFWPSPSMAQSSADLCPRHSQDMQEQLLRFYL